MFDCDFPDPKNSKFELMALWMIANICTPPGSVPAIDESTLTPPDIINVDESAGTVLLPYVPPHPCRGAGYPKYVNILFGHDHPLSLDSLNLYEDLAPETTSVPNFYRDRLLSVKCLMKRYHLRISSFNWFTSTWTKSVSSVYPRHLLGVCERVFGNDMRDKIHDVGPYKYEYI